MCVWAHLTAKDTFGDFRHTHPLDLTLSSCALSLGNAKLFKAKFHLNLLTPATSCYSKVGTLRFPRRMVQEEGMMERQQPCRGLFSAVSGLQWVERGNDCLRSHPGLLLLNGSICTSIVLTVPCERTHFNNLRCSLPSLSLYIRLSVSSPSYSAPHSL